MSNHDYTIPLSVDEVFAKHEITTPTILVKLLVFWQLTALGLGTLETSTLLPVPLYGCWSAINNPQLSGTAISQSNGSSAVFTTTLPLKRLHVQFIVRPDQAHLQGHSEDLPYQTTVQWRPTVWYRSGTNEIYACGSFSWWQPLAWAGTLLTIGRMMMCLAGGIGADIFGRRRSAIVWSGAYVVFAFIRSFAPIMEVYIMCITMEAICSQVATIALILVVCEGCTQKECVRTVCLTLLGHAIAVSVLIPLVYTHLENGIYRQLSRSVPGVIFVFLIVGLPESIKWVLSQGRLDQIEPTIKWSHGLEIDEFTRAKLFQINTQIRKERAATGCSGNLLKQSIFPLFTTAAAWRVTIPFVLISFFVGSAIGFRLLYDPLPYHSIEDRLITCGIAEILAIQLVGLLCARMPIKRIAASFAVLFSLVLMATRSLTYFQLSSCVGNIVVSGGGHMVSISIWVWLVLGAIRLVPTHSRGALLGICVSFGTLGHSFSKVIYESLWREVEWGMFYPVFVFSTMVVLAGFLFVILPDTPKVLPDMMCHILPRKIKSPRLIESGEPEEAKTDL